MSGMSEHGPPGIVIAGGGMVGISLALRLAQLLPASLPISLVEALPLPAPGTAVGAAPPSFDARSTALSLSSQQIFSAMGLWSALAPQLCPITTIHVSSRGQFGSSVLRASEQGWPALGWVAENVVLGRVLGEALRAQPRIRVLNPAQVISARVGLAGVALGITEGPAAENPTAVRELQAELLVVADGARSGLRGLLGIGARETPYRQHALIANLAFARDHKGCAWERFTSDGPLALLPLAPAQGMPRRMALVWSVDSERAGSLLDAAEAEFARRVQARFGYRLGRIERVGERSAYPLALVEATEQVRRHIVVLGNAAHALHPVAGQGFNLALRDVEALARVLADGVAEGAAPGDPALLARYSALQHADQRRTVMASDRLPGLFMHRDPLLGLGRSLGLAGLDLSVPLKQAFVRHAAGVAALDRVLRHG
jgi:2-octaprenyl-6-methoxyphenol hydroxylase